uniref:Putative tx1-3 aae n=1 Tax=Aedes albopictus TaxID=7160 RepID=A0A1W7R675_AEDAL
MPYIRKIATINLNAISCRVKQHLLKEFVWNNDLDVVFMQEVAFENFSFLPTHTAVVNISEDGKGTGILIRTNIQFTNLVMNTNGRITSLVIDGINYIDVYAHSGSKYKKERDLLFTDEMMIHLGEFKENVVLGDFNCITDKKDSTGAVKNICNGLKKMIAELQLLDVELSKNSHRVFTFVRGDSKSRLDRIYGSEAFIKNVRKIETIAVPFSDHCSVVMTLEITDVKNMNFFGRGYWKINSSLIAIEDIQDKFKTYYAQLRNRNSFQHISFWWNNDLKSGIKRFFKGESFALNQQITREKSFYYKCFNEAAQYQALNLDAREELTLAKSKLMSLEQKRLNRFRKKLKAHSLHSDEKLSFFHVTSFINRSSNSKLLKLKLNGEITSNPARLKEAIFEYFSEKYKNDNSHCGCGNTLDYLNRQLDKNDRQQLVKPIEIAEIEQVVNEASKNSSPGPDGINYEFYVTFFDLLKNDLVSLYNSYLIGGDYPPGLFTSGIIALIPKKGDNLELANRRPISMLNSDYKIFTKILFNRLKPMMEKLLGPGQSASIENSSCVNNLSLLRNIIIKANKSRKFKGILLSVDLEKAFDRVDHRYLWEILKKFAFPDRFIECLEKLYKNASSKVLFNGFLTNSFSIECSVRQGCPLSMALFALYIEPLLRMIDKHIQGVLVDNIFIRIVAYADDLNIFIRNDEEFSIALELINYFSIYSKIKINFSKSHFLRLNNCPLGPQLISEARDVKILGVRFVEDYRKMVDLNYVELIENVNYSLSLQYNRRLNIVQKVWILNTYILSKLWYVAQLIPPENKHIAQLRKKCGDFIWKGFFYKVERKELYAPIYKGGLSLTCVESKTKALFIKNILLSGQNGEIDNFMIQQAMNKNLTLNTREWIKLSVTLEEQNLKSSKQIYDYLILKQNIKIKQQEKNQNFQWETFYENFNQNFICSESKSTLFCVFRDIIPCNSKLYKHRVRGIDSPTCDSCGRIDTVDHRIKICSGSGKVWVWLNNVLKSKFKINVADAMDLLQFGIKPNNCKYKAALWLVTETINYCTKNYSNGSVEDLIRKISVKRWNNKQLFCLQFKKYMYLL